MRNYLYSPSFFEKAKSGKFADDLVFKIWKNIAGTIDEGKLNFTNHKDTLFRYLAPLLFGQSRIPF